MSQNHDPLVSVIVPCLNRAHYLRETIESILQQDYPNIECIVIDGGSTDGTIEILKWYGIIYQGMFFKSKHPEKVFRVLSQ